MIRRPAMLAAALLLGAAAAGCSQQPEAAPAPPSEDRDAAGRAALRNTGDIMAIFEVGCTGATQDRTNPLIFEKAAACESIFGGIALLYVFTSSAEADYWTSEACGNYAWLSRGDRWVTVQPNAEAWDAMNQGYGSPAC